MRESVRSGVKDIIKRVGVTAVLVTHDQEEAFDIADRVVVFNRSAFGALGVYVWPPPPPSVFQDS